MPERYPPEDPREWLNRAHSNLVLAKAEGQGIYLEDLCFNVQQATEKAVKALLIRHNIEFPYVHDIAELLTLLERSAQEIPEPVRQAEKLTRFAVLTRYPIIAPPINSEEYEEALALAEKVIRWVEELLDQENEPKTENRIS